MLVLSSGSLKPSVPTPFQVGMTWGNTFHGLFSVLQSHFQNRLKRSLILLEYDVKTIFSFSWVGKSIVCLCLNLLTKRKRRKNPLEAKRIVLSQAFILEKKKFKKKKKANLVWPVSSGKGQELLLGTTFSEPNHHAVLCLLCKPRFPDIAVSQRVGPRTEVAFEILALSTAQHCSQCHLHRRPEPPRLEAVPPSVIWEHFLSALWCHNSGGSLCTPPRWWDLEVGNKLELLKLGFPSYYRVTFALQAGPSLNCNQGPNSPPQFLQDWKAMQLYILKGHSCTVLHLPPRCSPFQCNLFFIHVSIYSPKGSRSCSY